MVAPRDEVHSLTAQRIVLGVTGSIAAYKSVELLRLLRKGGVEVQVFLTRTALDFVGRSTFEALSGRPVVAGWSDQTEIVHVEAGHRTDAFLIAPATAHFLAQMAHGLAPDPLLAALLSFEGEVVVAPAMESRMWRHPATQANVETLRIRGVRFLGPETGELASGRDGEGRMMEPAAILAALRTKGDLHGRRFLITAGPTRESLDPVRVLSNRSTGTMGLALAREAARRGAEVDLVLGPIGRDPGREPGLGDVRIHPVETALDMQAAVQAHLQGASVFIAAAAVTDFRPAEPRPQKLKKDAPGAERIELVRNPDILAQVGRAPQRPPVVVGFAAETEDVLASARDKRIKKGADAIVANQVGLDRGFGEGETEVHWIGDDAEDRSGPVDKAGAARFVVDRISRCIRRAEG